MAHRAIWNGPHEQYAELVAIVQHTCQDDKESGCGTYTVASQTMGKLSRQHTCASHDALAWSQAFLDNLVLLRYLRPRLEAEELDDRAWPGELKLSQIISGARG